MQKFASANINKVYVLGTIITIPQFSHSTFGQDFFTFKLEVRRLSGYMDILPITVSRNFIDEIKIGLCISIIGQLRSYNIIIKNANRLMITVCAKKIAHEKDSKDASNEIYLEVYVCKSPIYRITPFKREICDLLIACNRSYGKSDYIPAIAWGKNAIISKEFTQSNKISLNGRVQSRTYKKTLDNNEQITKTAYEVSITTVEKIE